MESSNRSYQFTEVQPPTVVLDAVPRRLPVFHILLLTLTIVSTTLTGAAESINITEEPSSIVSFFFATYERAVNATMTGDFLPLANGLLFSLTLLLILGAHEMGHYLACRYYGVQATLPFFIPAPPFPLTPFGTLGAVIKIKEQIKSRRALFDIGIAGPLAGFAVALPASVLGLVLAVPAVATDSSGFFEDPLLFRLIMKMVGAPAVIEWNPLYWASWAALLVTALNLFPVGQLDGGHVLYAIAGKRIHKWISRVISVSVALLAIASMVYFNSPIWLLWTVVLFFLTRVGHPPVIIKEPLGPVRIALAILAIIVFALCFLPFPVKIT